MAYGLKLLFFASLLSSCVALKILVVITLPGKSHGILGDGLVRHLTGAGHEVTFITPFPPKSQKNLTIIDVSENIELFKGGQLNIQNMMKGEVDLQSMLHLMELSMKIGQVTLENPHVQNLLRDTEQTFDVIIAEYIFQDLYAGFAAVYDCPFIWFSTLEPHWLVLRLSGDTPNPAYVADATSNNSPPYTFHQRVEELFNQIYGNYLRAFYIAPVEDECYEKYFVPHIRSRNKLVPSLTELSYNASLILSSTHVSLGEATSLPQNFKPIGGFHIDANVKPLPQDLQKLMDNAEHGVIYFSMGSNLRSEELPEELVQKILKIFGELKQTVIWKFEKQLPNRPNNVHIVHWAPQQSILAHSKCLFFISHGGLLSTTEAVHFGVPIIGIPVMVDQFVNVNRAVRKGFAIRVDLSYTMDKDLKRAINIMLIEPKYTVRAKEISTIYHDRPVPPGVELVHWVEHAVKTRGALHLRSPALMVPWYQKCYADLLAVIVILIYIIKTIIQEIISRIFKKKDNNKKKDRKKNK